MTYYVSVENGVANQYTATVIGWLDCVAEGSTREEAITRVKQKFTERLHQIEIVPIKVDSTYLAANFGTLEAIAEHPWAKFAGMYQSNPLFDEVLDSIQAYRRELDADETVVCAFG